MVKNMLSLFTPLLFLMNSLVVPLHAVWHWKGICIVSRKLFACFCALLTCYLPLAGPVSISGLCTDHTRPAPWLGGAEGRQGTHLLRQPQQPHHHLDTAHCAGIQNKQVTGLWSSPGVQSSDVLEPHFMSDHFRLLFSPPPSNGLSPIPSSPIAAPLLSLAWVCISILQAG